MSAPTQLAEAIQTAHIKRDPDPRHDLNPSTAASTKKPLTVSPHGYVPRRTTKFPPMPDMRFEQSYLHSIEKAGSWWEVALITVKDQVMLPLIQGFAWNMILCGWQYWNRNARIHGSGVGARVRRWWYEVNNWKIPAKKL